jgi:hypothetical protein
MGQLLSLPPITDTGNLGFDYFLNTQQVGNLKRSGIDMDHLLNPYSFPRITSPTEKKIRLKPPPKIVNLPTHISPKSLQIVPRIIIDSTGSSVITYILRCLISTTSPAILSIFFCPTQQEFTTNPTNFTPRHPFLQTPIQVPIHPCVNELLEITLPQCFVEYLAFHQLSHGLEQQGTDLETFYGCGDTNSTQPTLFSQVFSIQNVPVRQYLQLYRDLNNISLSFCHIAMTMRTLLPVETGTLADPDVRPNTTTQLLSSLNSSHENDSNNSPNGDNNNNDNAHPYSASNAAQLSALGHAEKIPSERYVVTEWLTLMFKTTKHQISASLLRDVINNYQINGSNDNDNDNEYEIFNANFDGNITTDTRTNSAQKPTQPTQPTQSTPIHSSLTLPARDSVLYRLLQSISVQHNLSTHHIKFNDECLELLELYGFTDVGNNDDINSTASIQENLQNGQNGSNNTENNINIEKLLQDKTDRIDPVKVTLLSLSLSSIIANNTISQTNTQTNSSPPTTTTPIPSRTTTTEDLDTIYPYLTQTPNDCTVCMTAPSTHVIYPCRHLCLCAYCADHVIKKAEESRSGGGNIVPGAGENANATKCPICRQPLACIFNLEGNGGMLEVTAEEEQDEQGTDGEQGDLYF